MSNSTTSTSTRPVAQLWATRQGFGIRVYSQSDFEWLHYYIKYTHHVSQLNVLYTPTAPSYAVVYINTMRVPDTLIPGVRNRFQIVNDQPKVAWAKIDLSQKLAGRIASTKSAIAKYNLNREIKPAMIKVFGSPVAVKTAFVEHNFYIKGHATLTQCLRLLELTKHLKECLALLQQSPAPSVDAPAIPKPVEPVTVPVEDIPPHRVLTCAYEPKSCPLATPLACRLIDAPQVNDPENNPVDIGRVCTGSIFDREGRSIGSIFNSVHAAAAELDCEVLCNFFKGLTIKELRQYMKHCAIPTTGTRGYKKAQVVEHIIDFYYA